MIKIALCDDDKNAINKYKNLITALLQKRRIVFELKSYTDPGVLMREYYESFALPFDLILLDIEMPGMDGLNLAKEIRKKDASVLIIFFTGHEEYVFNSFEHAPFRYVPKSRFDMFMPKALIDACNVIEEASKKNRYYHIVTPQSEIRLLYDHILYIDKHGKYSILHSINGDSYSMRKAISEVFSEFDKTLFLMINSGCIANIKYIKQIKIPVIILENGITLVSSRSKQKGIREAVHQYWSESI